MSAESRALRCLHSSRCVGAAPATRFSGTNGASRSKTWAGARASSMRRTEINPTRRAELLIRALQARMDWNAAARARPPLPLGESLVVDASVATLREALGSEAGCLTRQPATID